MIFKQRLHGRPLASIQPSTSEGATGSYGSMFPDDLKRAQLTKSDLKRLAAATLRSEDDENAGLPSGYT